MTGIPDAIERVALLGWRLYPASRTTKAAMFKEPAARASCDLDVIAGWCREYPRANWRVVMDGSGVWGLDVDAPGATHTNDGLATLAGLVEQHGALPLRPTTRSGGGGLALFFRHDGEPITGETNFRPGLDPRRGRQSITIPPSIHVVTRQPYAWLVAPWDVAAPPAPAWLLRLVKPRPEPVIPAASVTTTDDRARRRLLIAVDAVAAAGAGQANDTLNRQAFAMGRHVAAGTIGEGEVAASLYAAARNRRVPDREARDTIRSGLKAGYAKPLERHVA